VCLPCSKASPYDIRHQTMVKTVAKDETTAAAVHAAWSDQELRSTVGKHIKEQVSHSQQQ
jgi:hypothetical protein